MLHGETIATLRNWEAQFPVLSWSVRGLHVWPLVRTRMASRLLAAGAPPDAGIPPGGTPSGPRAARKPNGHAERDGKPPSRAEAIFLGRPANRQLVDGRWYDRIFDPMADILEEDGSPCLHLEYRPTGGRHLVPRYRPAVAVRGPVTWRNVVAAVQSVRPARLDGFDAFTRAVRQHHPGVSAVTPLWIARQARSVEMAARYFERVIRRSGARVACCSVYYTLVGMAFCLAARRAGIPSVDVQHGVTAGNPAYDGWSRFPDGGFELLPSRFWCWSSADARAVRSWPGTAAPWHSAFVGGHPWLALWGSPHPLAAKLRSRVPDRRRASLAVLVTLNWSSGFSERLQSLMRSAPADWIWWIRLHPLMARERGAIQAWCDGEIGGRAEVDEPTDLPLPLLVEAADVHVTHNSSVIQEAARLGRPSVAIDTRALDVYGEELSTGWAVVADDPQTAIAAIRAQHTRRGTLVPLEPYPTWPEVARAVRALVAEAGRCPATAPAASSRTPAPA